MPCVPGQAPVAMVAQFGGVMVGNGTRQVFGDNAVLEKFFEYGQMAFGDVTFHEFGQGAVQTDDHCFFGFFHL